MQDNLELNLDAFFKNIFFHIFHIAAIFFIVLSCTTTIYFFTDRIYRVSSMIEVNPESSELGLDFVDQLSSSDVVLDEQISLYTSHTNILKLINELELDISASIDSVYLDNHNDYFTINDYFFPFDNHASDKDSANNKKFTFYVKKIDESNVQIFDENLEVFSTRSLIGSMINFPAGSISFKDVVYTDLPIKIEIYNPLTIKDRVLSSLTLVPELSSRYSWEQGNLINIYFDTSDTQKGVRLVDKANEIYITQDRIYAEQEADNSLLFIDSQLEAIGSDLTKSEIELNNFQSIYGTINVDIEIEGLISELAAINEKIRTLRVKKVELASKFNSQNPQIISLNQQEEELRSQLDIINQSIKSLPKTQQEYINLYGQVQINKSIYEQLLAKKLEFSIVKASTLGNVKVIDTAYVSEKVYPTISGFFISGIILASILSILFLVIKNSFFRIFEYPNEVTELFNSTKLVFIINKIKNIDGIINIDQISDNLSALGVNISLLFKNQLNKDGGMINIVGSTQSIGKSTVAKLLALSLVKNGKSVLLIDFDFRKGSLHKMFKKSTLKNFSFIDNPENLDSFKIYENLYLIPRVKSRDRSLSVIIESESFNNFISIAKTKFDFIVIDTPPANALPEPLILANKSDLNISIVRHRSTRPRDFKITQQLFNDLKIPLNLFIYNDFTRPIGNYYHDDYSYNYYSYGYEYYGDDND